MQCAILSDDLFNTSVQDKRGVCSTSHLGKGTPMPAMGVGTISQACIKLIRSLLKEGGRTGTVSESAHFLDLINRHLRGFFSRGWNLPKQDYENLKKCLFRLVKVIAERPAVDVLSCAPLTPPLDNTFSHPSSTLTRPPHQIQTCDAEAGPSGLVDATNFLKEEPLWVHDGYCDGHEEIVKTKEEPCSPIPISVSKPLERIHITSGKIQEMRSRITKQNLFKIQAIAKGKLGTGKEQVKSTRHASSPQPLTSQSNRPDSAKLSKSSKRESNDEDDDEPLDVRMHRLKRSRKSGGKASTDAEQVSMSSSAKEVSTGSILDDVASDDPKLIENRVMCDPSLDLDATKSPERDYDDLSESQVFEFETQADIASAWNEPHIDITDVTKKPKFRNDSKACVTDAVVPVATQPISDEDIEKACLRVEKQICKQQHELGSSSIQVPPSSSFTVDSKQSKSPSKKTGLTDKRGKQLLAKKPLIIAALSQKIKKRYRSLDAISDPVKPCSSTMLTSSSVSPSTVAPSKGSSASSVSPLKSIPAVVPPKKVRKRIEPELPAELIGLKKKERKAFEFSQRSLAILGELRTHGQNVHVEPQQNSKKVRQQKANVKGKKLLASKDMQYIRQHRKMLQKSRLATPSAKSNQPPVPDTLPNSKPAAETVEEPRDEEDDYFFLPCSQPDPDQRTDNNMGTGEAGTSLSDEPVKSKEISALQYDDGAVGFTAEDAASGDKNCDDEWLDLTQNEPTDMELCSQMEQIEEEYGENLITDGVHMDSDSGNQPNIFEAEISMPLKPVSCNAPQKSLPGTSTVTISNDHRFLKPSGPIECQKKAKPSTTKIYASSSRNASLVKEMEKVANPLPPANVAKAKVARPPPVMPPPAMPPPAPKSTPQHAFGEPLPPRPTSNSSKQVLKPSMANVTLALQVPSYKTYARPETPVPVQAPPVDPGRRFDNSPMFDQAYLKQAILKWEYRMFENYEMFGTPQDLCPLALKKVPTSFSNYTEYFTTLYPLLLINTFEEVGFRTASKHVLHYKLYLFPIHEVGHLMDSLYSYKMHISFLQFYFKMHFYSFNHCYTFKYILPDCKCSSLLF